MAEDVSRPRAGKKVMADDAQAVKRQLNLEGAVSSAVPPPLPVYVPPRDKKKNKKAAEKEKAKGLAGSGSECHQSQ